MSKWEKLLREIRSLSRELRFDELRRVLESYGYMMCAPRGGSTGGAGVQTAAACTQNARQARTNALTSGPKPPPRLPQSKKIC